MKSVLLESSIIFNQAAVLSDGKLIDYLYESTNNSGVEGNIYKGKVMDILPGMEAAFVDIGLGKNAYLFLRDLLTDKHLKELNISKKEARIENILKKGQELLLQVVREPIGEKNVSVTADISLTGKYIALVPNTESVNISKKIKNFEERKRLTEIGKNIMSNGKGMIIRTFAFGGSKEVIEKEYKMLSVAYKQIEREYNYSYAPKLLHKNNSLIERLFLDYIDSSVSKVYVEDKESKEKFENMISGVSDISLSNIEIIREPRSFEKFGVNNQIEMLFKRRIELNNGGFIVIDVTEALTVIDVNSGKYIGRRNMEETALEINLKAIEEIVRQVKLRNISGIILIDFIDVRNEKSINQIVNRAKLLFKDDTTVTDVLGMTRLNLMEITRKKTKDNFYNIITEECMHCSGSGRSSSSIYIFIKIENIIKNIKLNTSTEAVILKAGYLIYNKITKDSNCMNMVLKIENKYGIRIFFERDEQILTDEIIIGRMGKLSIMDGISRM